MGTQDKTNCIATADIIVDDRTILTEVPVTHLLFLEKQLEDLYTFTGKLPTLDPAEKWDFSEQSNCYVSQEKETMRTKRAKEVIVKYEATEKHPAQTELVEVEKQVGKWSTIKFSGAVGKKEKEKTLDKIRKLQKAVKFAREEANNTVADKVEYGTKLLKYIFSD